MVSNYVLGYEREPNYETYVMLKSVKRCDADGACLPATRFTYGDAIHSFVPSPPSQPIGGLVSEKKAIFSGNIDGDGKDDLVEVFHNNNGLGFRTLISNGTNFTSGPEYLQQGIEVSSLWANVDPYAYHSLDLNGDGLMDIVRLWAGTENNAKICFSYYLSNGINGFTKGGDECTDHELNTRDNIQAIFPMDYDGDGRGDLVHIWKNGKWDNMRIFRSDGTNLVYLGEIETDGKEGGHDYIYLPADVNGDSCTDVVRFRTNGNIDTTPYISYCNTGSGYPFYKSPNSTAHNMDYHSYTNQDVQVTDINGDGTPDLVFIGKQSGNHHIVPFIFDGTKYIKKETLSFSDSADSLREFTYMAMDVNGDGWGDLIRLDGRTDDKLYTRTFISNGNSYNLGTAAQPMGHGYGKIDYIPMDINGDGTLDMVQTWDRSGNVDYIPYLAKFERSFIKKIIDGLDGNIDISYKSLSDTTDAKIYKKDTYCPINTNPSSCPYPIQDVQNTLQVVSNYTETDGRDRENGGYEYSHSYFYTGGKSDVNRGWLGFRTIEAKNEQSKIARIDTYRQDFPYNGMLENTKIVDKSTSTSKTQQEAQYAYRNLRSGTTFNEVVLDLERNFTYNYEGDVSYWQTKKYKYDYDFFKGSSTGRFNRNLNEWYGNLVLVEDLGDGENLTDINNTRTTPIPIYSCTRYRNDSGKNRLGYVAQSKVTTDHTNCIHFINWWNDNWNDNRDISWSAMEYDDQTMNLNLVKHYDNKSPVSNKWNVTTYGYDDYGNVEWMDDGFGAYTTTYDNFYHTFPVSTTTPPNNRGVTLTEATHFEPYYGNEIATIDPNGIISEDDYNKLGRIVSSKAMPPGGTTTNDLKIADKYELLSERREVNGKTYTDYFSKVSSLHNWDDTELRSWSKSYVNAKGVNYKSNALGPEGKVVEQKTIFDDQGRVIETRAPYFIDTYTKMATSDIAKSTVEYDIYGYNYQEKVTSPDGSTTCYYYTFPTPSQPLMQIKTNIRFSTANCSDAYKDDDEITLQYLNARGNIKKTILPNSNWLNNTETSKVEYEYDAVQRLTRQIDPEGVESKYTYDSLGRIHTEYSGDTGTTTYNYDIYDRLINMSDADGSVISFTYDNLRRALTRTASWKTDDDTTKTETTEYTYDDPSKPNGLGNLTSIKIPHNIGSASETITYSYGYDQNGLPAYFDVVRGIDDVVRGIRTYSFEHVNDPEGRGIEQKLPDGSYMKAVYDAGGGLIKIALNASNDVNNPQEIASVAYSNYTELGNPENATYGNGVQTAFKFISAVNNTHEPYGALEAITIEGRESASSSNRVNLLHLKYGWKDDSVETITDNLSNPVHAQSFTYHKGMSFLDTATSPNSYGTQSFVYHNAGSFDTKNSAKYQYPASPKSHRIQTITPPGSSVPSITLGYSGNGNIKSKSYSANTGINFTYDAFANLRQVDKSANGATEPAGLYAYDDSGERITKVDQNNYTTWYITPSYEVLWDSSDNPRYTRYLDGLNGRAALFTADGDGSNATR